MKDYKIPIVIVHKGDSKYLPASILQLRHSNPSTPICFLGDEQNRRYKSLVSHYDIKDFFETAREFEKHYIHYSTNGHTFELTCLQRWFVLNEFLQGLNVSQCIYLDSDVLVYDDLDNLQRGLSSYAMTVSGISAHTNFINDRKVLDDFCHFVRKTYMEEKETGRLNEKYQAFLKIHPAGGISDMTFFTEVRKLYPQKILDLSIPRNNTVFDITLDTIQDYESSGGYKKIVWKNGVPYAKHLGLNEYCRFHTLHFQGKCKKRMYNFVTYPFRERLKGFYLRTDYFRNKVRRKLLG